MISNLPRVRLLRCLPSERPLQVPVHPVCMDPHGSVLDRRPGTFRHQQHIRGDDLVLHARLTRHHQRHFCLPRWHYHWSDAANQAFPQEDLGRLHRRLALHHNIWVWTDELDDEKYVLYVPCERKLLPSLIMQAQVLMIIHDQDLGANVFTGLDCVPNPVFLTQEWHLPIQLPEWYVYISSYCILLQCSTPQDMGEILTSYAGLISHRHSTLRPSNCTSSHSPLLPP